MVKPVDTRTYVYCNIGPVISGSFSESSALDAGLVVTTGSVILKGIFSPAEGSACELAYYDVVTNKIARLGRTYKVISYTCNPFEGTTEVSFACPLGYVQDYEPPVVTLNSSTDPNSTINKDDMSELQKAALLRPISAKYIAERALNTVGLSASLPLNITLYREDFLLEGNYLSYVNDFCVSENKLLYANSGGGLSILDTSNLNSSGPSVTEREVIALNGIGSPIRGATRVYTEYDYIALDAEALERDQDDEQTAKDLAFCSKSTSTGLEQVQEYTYQEFDSELDPEDRQEITYEAKWIPRSETKVCTDSEGREISSVETRYDYYGKTITETTTEYKEETSFSVGNSLSTVIGGTYGSVSNSAFNSVSAKALDAFNRAADALRSIRYTMTADEFKEAWDGLLEQFQTTTTTRETTVTEPGGRVAEGINLPNELLALSGYLEPKPSTYSQIIPNPQITSKSYEVSVNAPWFSATYTEEHTSSYRTTKGSNKIAKYLESFTVVEGETYQWDELDISNPSSIFSKCIGLATPLTLQDWQGSSNVTYVDYNEIIEQYKEKKEEALSNNVYTQQLNRQTTTEYVTGAGNTGPGITVTYSPPYTSDDRIVVTSSGPGYTRYGVVRSNAAEQASAYARVQNKLAQGQAYGISVTLPIKYFPNRPLSPIYVNARSKSAKYLMDNWTVAFDSSGILMQANLLLQGGVLA